MTKNPSKKGQIPNCWNSIGVWGHSEERCERLNEVVHCHNCDVFSQAGRSIFDRRPPSGYIPRWSKSISLPQNSRDEKNIGVIIFRIEREWFAFPANIFHEITEDKSVHSVPRNEEVEIAGIVNISGEVKICYSLANLLGIKQGGDENNNNGSRVYRRLIIIIIDGDYYVFQVSEVVGLYRYKVGELLPVPTTLEKNQADYLSGLFKYEKHHIALLNPDNIRNALQGILL